MKRLGKTFVIYQGHHGDKGAMRADVIFPDQLTLKSQRPMSIAKGVCKRQ
jgi:NADH dehydrogenase/NADH:ubiquinone oxidoreductase subunit G